MPPQWNKRQWTWIINQEIPSKKKKIRFYYKDGHTLEQVAQKGCKVSISGDSQNPTGHNPRQWAVGDPVWAGHWSRWSQEVLSNFHDAVILGWSCCSCHGSSLYVTVAPLCTFSSFPYSLWGYVRHLVYGMQACTVTVVFISQTHSWCLRKGRARGSLLSRQLLFSYNCLL